MLSVLTDNTSDTTIQIREGYWNSLGAARESTTETPGLEPAAGQHWRQSQCRERSMGLGYDTAGTEMELSNRAPRRDLRLI